MASTRADHDLLFEALAIHLGFVTRSAVEEARKTVARDDASATSVVDILSTRAGLTAESVSVLEMLVKDMLAKQGGDAAPLPPFAHRLRPPAPRPGTATCRA